MSARKIVVEETPQFTPEQMAEAAASIPAVVENVQPAAERIEQIAVQISHADGSFAGGF